jgi:hypothetical protein
MLLYYSIIGLCTYEYGVTISLCGAVLLYTVWLCLLLCDIDNIPTVCCVYVGEEGMLSMSHSNKHNHTVYSNTAPQNEMVTPYS